MRKLAQNGNVLAEIGRGKHPHRDPECRFRLEILYIRQERMRQPRCRNRAAGQLGAEAMLLALDKLSQVT